MSMNAHDHHHHKYYYQSLKLLLIAALVVVTPLLSPSLRSKYLYFVVNILIIAIGAEAGLVSFFFRSGETKKSYFPTKEKSTYLSITADDDGEHDQSGNGTRLVNRVSVEAMPVEAMPNEVEKILLPPSSNPSIFFIGGGDSNEHINNNVISQAADQELLIMEDDDEELFQKAEMFIRNFYKQLKMQKEESLAGQ